MSHLPAVCPDTLHRRCRARDRVECRFAQATFALPTGASLSAVACVVHVVSCSLCADERRD